MATPSPIVALGPSSLDLLYGTSGNLQLTFDESSGTGFEPWLELQVAAPSSHLSFGAASWALLPIATKTYTFTRSGTSVPYTLVHPITGAILTSATPDTLLIWQLPVGSYVASAPAVVVSVPVSVKATSPMLGPVPLRAGGGYALGTDPLNNPSTDPPISAPNVTGQVVPSPLTFSKSNNLAESETATGPNFIGAWRLSADIADGAQLNKLVVSDTLPNDLNLLEINPSLKLNGKLTQQPVGNPTAPSNNQVVIDYGGPTTGTTSTEEAAAQIRFFVPDTLDPTTGGAITYANNASVSATWGNSPDGSVKLNTPANNEITAKALAIQKSASSGSVLPGGDVTFTLNFQISDYFAFGDLIVKDLLGDGLTYTPGSARINLQEQGVSLTGNGSAAFDPAYITYLPDVAGPGVDGKDSLSFNLSGWLKSIGNDGILQGGRVFSTTAGATRGSITFTASVDDLYVAPKAAGQNIKPGDQLANNVTLQGDIQKQLPLGLFLDTNRQVSDTSGVAMSVADIGNAKTVVARNGQALGSAPLVLTPGDTVTYRIKVTFPIGDIHGFNLSDFLPTPIYNVDGEASGGASPTGFELFGSGATASSPGSLPPTGRFSYGSLHTAPPLVDNLLKTGPAVNDLVATIANTSDPTHTPVTVDLYYTVTVTGAAIADRLPITNIATANTVDSNGTSRPPQIAAVTGEVLAPNLKIRKGIVVTSRDSLSGNQKATYTPGLNTGGATFPASLGAAPFTGTVSSSGISVAGGNGSTGAVKSNALDSNVTGLDAGDTVRFVVVIENIGTSYRGAFNVQLRDELPAGLSFTPGSLRIVDGSGALIGYTRPDGTAASQADIFSATGVRLSDPGPTAADPLTGAGGGAIDGYNASSGRNIAVVTFDTTVDPGAYGQLVGGKLTNVGVLEDYTNVPSGGTGYLAGSTKLIDNASVVLRDATVSKTIVSTSEEVTAGSNVAIGEIVRYRLQVTVPEGNLTNFKLEDTLPAGISFLNDGTASRPVFSSGVSPSLTPSTPVISGSKLTWDFGNLTNSDRNNSVDDTIALEFNALVTNTSGITDGKKLTNTAKADYTGGSGSGSVAVYVVEPRISITKAVSPTSNVQAGDTLTYTVTVSNADGHADAFDLVLNDALGNLGSNFNLQSVTLPSTLPLGTSSVINNSITNKPSAADGDRIDLKIDRLNYGQSFSFTYTGVVLTAIQPGTTLTNTANVTYTGLPGTGTPNGTGGNTTGSTTPGGSGAENGERNGSGGVNNYSKSASQSVVSQALGPIKSTRLTSEAHTSGNGVAIGEIVRFRLQTSIPQGTIGNTSFVDNLPTGLTFLNDNTASLAFVSTNPADLTWSLGPITPYYLPSAGNNNTVIPTARFAPTVTGQALTWSLGQIVNLNAVDAQIESVIVEFNAIVANVASNQAGVNLTNSFIAKSSLSGITSQVTSSAPPLSVLEPKLETDKTVAIEKTGVAGNANATPGDTLVYTVVVRNTGTAKAFNLFIDDNLDALGLNFDLSGSPTIVQSQTGAPAPTDNSIFSGSNGLADRISVLIPELDINQSVTLTYRGVLSAGLPPGTALTNTAQVTYTSLPGTGTPTGSGGNSTGSSTPGGSGAANGERNGDGGVNDYLSSKTLILVANRPPVAVNDTGNAVEAGGTSNTTPGSNATGSLLTNDTDPDPADNPLTSKGKVTSFRTGSTEGSGTAGSLGSPLLGTYGQLTVNADGTYTYVVDNRNALVDALDPGASLSESFNYTVSDGALSDIGVISITIQGANDAPLAANDTGTVVEAGGTPGATATGNVISNDRDIDNRDGNNLVAPPEGTVVAVRTGAKEGAGTAGTVGAALKGLYGSLTLSANGTYTYVVDNTNPMVDALNPGDTLSESFNYTLLDHRDGLNDIAVLTITIQGRNDAPVALNDAGSALEAGGTSNGTPGANAIGNVLTNDTDVDSNDTPALNGFVESFRTGATEGSGTAGTIGAPLQGLYGSITFQANGTYTYVVDNANPAVDSLDPGAFLSESFNYTVSDGALTDIGVLTITISGANDSPVAADDIGNAVEAGGTFNGTPGSNAVGNVIANDRDVDKADGNNLVAPPSGTITAIRTGGKEGSGTAGIVGSSLNGLYGSLTLNANGSYTYVVNNTNPVVNALDAGDILRDVFNYTLLDHTGGLTDTAVLTVILTGSNDAPVAINDTGTSLEAGGTFNGTAGSNATGNVLLNDTDVDAGDTPSLNGSVSAIRTGAIEGSGAAGAVGTGLKGTYGTLTINANGTYTYVVDNSNPKVEALDPGASLSEAFNYTVLDRPGGLSDIGVLTITINGANDAPIAVNDAGTAKEKGGTFNATPGADATGNVISNDRDVDAADGSNLIAPPLGTVISIRTGDKEGSGSAGTLGSALAGTYGTLTLNADGSYTYGADNTNPAVDSLNSGDVLTETFNYTILDHPSGLTDTAVLTINIQGANDAPVARDDVGTAVEAGGINNTTGGANATGNVFDNDTDVDSNDTPTINGTVTAIRLGATEGSGAAGTPSGSGFVLAGLYGTLTINANGTYTYVVDNSNTTVEALNPGDSLSEAFNYTVRDSGGLTDIGVLTLSIKGANDAPVAVDDTGSALEAGGTFNATPGNNATGNVLANDTDVDSNDTPPLNGTVLAIRTGDKEGSGNAGSVGSALQGIYGALTLTSGGSYTYVLNNSDPRIDSLNPGDVLTDSFNYTVLDHVGGLTDSAVLTITINGTNDAPVAADDTGTALEAGGISNGTAGSNATGNVLSNDTDVDRRDTPAINGAVSAIRTGASEGSGTAGSVGTALAGLYGTLTINANGTYTYVVDNSNTTVEALNPGDSLSEAFNYTVSDSGGLTDIGVLTLSIKGANDAPVAVDDTGSALEAGGTFNATPGNNATGNVLANDTDVDSNDTPPLNGTVLAIRTGDKEGAGSAGTLGSALAGTYGSLTINADGSYTYVFDNSDPRIDSLNPGDVLTDSFNYTVLDHVGGLTDTAVLTITINGTNDAPVAADDSGTAGAAGGQFNEIGGYEATGNVLINDTDIDSKDTPALNGSVSAIRTGAVEGSGTAGSVGVALKGLYGTLTIASNGDYTYVVDNSNQDVFLLVPGSPPLLDVFNYTVLDRLTGGLIDTALLTITINGPDSSVDPLVTFAKEAGGVNNSTGGRSGRGDVISDANSSNFAVSAIKTAGGTVGSVGAPLQGLYGKITIKATGEYLYDVDNLTFDVDSMNEGDTLTESFIFTEKIISSGATNDFTLTVNTLGTNDAPVAANDAGTALEAGGSLNGTPGSSANGNVLLNDTDVDSKDTPPVNGTITAIRTGGKEGSGTAGSVGSAFQGAYGTLTISANGVYTYVVDNNNPFVDGLDASDFIIESFNYTVRDTGGLIDTAVLNIRINGANDAPIASDDGSAALEAGGVANGTAGSNATGNVLLNDTDVDRSDTPSLNGLVSAIRTGAIEGSGTAGSVGTALAGLYGTLTINANGTYTYVVDNSNTTVEALNPGDSLSEAFNYTVRDSGGLTDIGVLTLSIKGANDAPVAVNDAGTAKEKGGTFNATPGADATGNVISNDRDVDAADGSNLIAPPLGTVISIRTGDKEGSGTAGTLGSALSGAYGSLTLNADGTYTYVIDDSNPTVDALNPGDVLTDSFNYTLLDHLGGLTDSAVLTITINGTNDAPVAADDTGTALEAGGISNGTAGSNATGNVLSNDTDVDRRDTPAINGAVSAIRTGASEGSGTAGSVGTALAGLYGTLTINANGTYTYVVDNSNTTVEALNPGDSLSEAFNYTVSDSGGLTDIGVLTLSIKGANDAPVAVNDAGTAKEKGGTFNATPGADATGNVISNDRDVDSNDGGNLGAPPSGTVTAIRRGAKEGVGLAGTAIPGGFVLVGFYGTLTIQDSGDYIYVVDNNNRFIEGLDVGKFIIESFNYTVLDHPAGLNDIAVLNIRIDGANDAPVAIDDAGTALEAGGVANGTAGSNATGNVLTNDTDVDRPDTPSLNGSVTAIRTGANEGSGTAGISNGSGFLLAGLYGALTINANGTYTYVVDNANAVVDALSPADTLTEEFNYTVSDRGGLTDIGKFTITITGANDAPIAVNDTGTADEKGGTLNGTAGSNATGNVLANDTDVDNNDKPLTTQGSVTAIRLGDREGLGLAGAIGVALNGLYGSLTINADGSFTYVVDNDNPTVDALNPGDSLSETFNYTVRDSGGLTDTAVLTVTIKGANDAPIASDDSGSALEAGGVANGTAGSNATGNVLTNDTDVDSNDTPALNGVVTAIRTGASEGAGTAGTPDGAGAFVVRGAYGTLTINANGTYTYVVDNSNPLVDALSPGDSLQEEFNYTVRDLGGLTDIGVLRITIDGANDAPIARNDTGTALEAGGTNNGTPGTNSSGNVLTNDSDVDRNDTPLPTKGSVSGIRTGIKEGSGVAGVPDGSGGFVLVGTYGTLRINANGSYTYTVDNGNPAVDGMDAGDQFTETFNYTVLDTGGLSDIALLTITIKGANDAPVAGNDTSSAIEAGGTLNGTPGADAIGNVLTNDTDVDRSDTPSLNGAVTAIRLGDAEGLGTAGVVGSPLQGLYGYLTIDNNGNYRYLIDNANPTVEALNPGDLLSESFNYTVSDGGGLTDTAVLTITIRGNNDAPVASDDSGIAKEAGGINNSSGGANASGNVLANDTDVDSNDTPLPSKGTVTAIRTGAGEGTGTAGSVGSAIQGQYGSLLINANGSFTYVVNNSDLTVERLNVGEQLTEFFNYTVLDHSGGLTDIAVLSITVEGTNDNPNASDDYIGRLTSGQSGTIRVIANDTDIDSRLVPSTIKIEGTANPGEPLVVPGQGTWSVDPGNGDITFTPETGVTTSPTPIKYTVQDEQGATSNPATVYINYDSPSVGPEPPIPVTEARPVNLFLLLDNSTSMQGLDPTGVTRLEAQNRLAFYYGLNPVFNNAGYIFKKGDQIGFNGDVQLTPSQSLATEILSWELIDNPFDNKTAQTVTIHTIDFSYLVTHTKTVINSSSTAEGVTLASDVLATTTPDKQYGNSTSGDWIARGLPAPGNLDAYTAPGTPGNRYSGTEMLGALAGLKDLLNDELTSVATDTLTYVGLFTDGRPERRPWWDNRPEFGQGWSGVNVALPTDADLGGDPIISSGLRYLSNGTPIKVPTANGVDIWGQNQRELNAALDRTAAASGSPDNVKVISVGLGDGGISNWSAIYSDLFTNQTFNNQAGGWGYQVVTPNIQLQS